ncbi:MULTISPECIES: hypothetical protein [Moorena]|nr:MULTISPECIES: hypothetical protein [Moorena]
MICPPYAMECDRTIIFDLAVGGCQSATISINTVSQKPPMTKLIQETFEQIAQLSEEQQNALAIFLQKHLALILQQAEREKRIEENTYTINDFNEETQQAIINIEEQKNLTVCANKESLYNELGI